VDAALVDRLYADKSYFLGPDKGGERAYRLLGEALKKTNRVAIGQYAARGKQYLIMIRPHQGGLVLEQLRYANELRSMVDVDLPKTEVKKAGWTSPSADPANRVGRVPPRGMQDNARKRIRSRSTAGRGHGDGGPAPRPD
jgi:hypothetical protein